MTDLISISWEHVLNKLSMSFKQINSHYCILVFFVVAEYFLEIQPLFIS